MLVDAYSHVVPSGFLHHLEKLSGQPHVFSSLFATKSSLTDLNRRLHIMDTQQIDASVLVPLPWLEMTPTVYQNADKALLAAQIANDTLAEMIATVPDRFFGVALLPTTTPDVMLHEFERAVTTLGMAGGVLFVSPTHKRVDHPDLLPIFERAAELDVPLWLHPARPATVPDYDDEPYSKLLQWQTLGWLVDTSSAMMRIVFAGLFDSYPNLKIITHHHGALIPLFAARMESGFESFESAGHHFETTITRPYLNHFRHFYTDTATFGCEPLLVQRAIDFFGADHVLFGTDTPMDHTEGVFIESAKASIAALALTEQERRKICADNILGLIRATQPSGG